MPLAQHQIAVGGFSWPMTGLSFMSGASSHYWFTCRKDDLKHPDCSHRVYAKYSCLTNDARLISKDIQELSALLSMCSWQKTPCRGFRQRPCPIR